MATGRGEQQWGEREEPILRAAARLRRGLHRHLRTGLLQFREARCADGLDAVLAERSTSDCDLTANLTAKWMNSVECHRTPADRDP